MELPGPAATCAIMAFASAAFLTLIANYQLEHEQRRIYLRGLRETLLNRELADYPPIFLRVWRSQVAHEARPVLRAGVLRDRQNHQRLEVLAQIGVLRITADADDLEGLRGLPGRGLEPDDAADGSQGAAPVASRK